MYYKMMIVLIVVAGFNLAYGQEQAAAEKVEQIQGKTEEKMEAGDDLKLPDKNTTEYWVIRSQACTEFIPLLTQLRSEKKETVDLMIQFLKKIGKAQDFLKSGVKAPKSSELFFKEMGDDKIYAELGLDLPKKPLDWEQAIEDGMKFVLSEGYLPTNVAGEEELAMIKQLCAQKETYGKKVRKELHETIWEGLDIWFYLETIGQQEACEEFVHSQFEAEQLAKEQEGEQVKGERKEKEFQRREQQKQNVWQERQDRLRNRYYGNRRYNNRRYRY
jgi:hypothetical protein